VKDKARRVAEYHGATIDAFLELLAGAGLKSASEIDAHQVLRRIDPFTIKHFDEIYPELSDGALLDEATVPDAWRSDWSAASAESW